LDVLHQIKATMAHTPQKTTINKLLQGLNNGLNLFKKPDGPRIEPGSSSEEEESTNASPNFLNLNPNGLASHTTDDIVDKDNVNNSNQQQATNIVVSPHSATMPPTKKKRQRKKAPTKPTTPPPRPMRKKKNKKKPQPWTPPGRRGRPHCK